MALQYPVHLVPSRARMRVKGAAIPASHGAALPRVPRMMARKGLVAVSFQRPVPLVQMRAARNPRSPARRRGSSSVDRKEGLQRQLTAKLSKATSAQEVLDILEPELEGDLLNHFHMSAAFTRLARHKQTLGPHLRRSPAVTGLVSKVTDLLENSKLPGRESSNVLWAIASLGDAGQCVSALVPDLVQALAVQAPTLDPQAVANVIWAAATLQLPDAQLRILLPKLCSQLLEQVSREGHSKEYDSQGVANIIWSTARLKGRSPELLEIHEVLAQLAVDKRTDMTPQELSNMMWAGAALKSEAPYLLEMLPRFMEEIRLASPNANAQDVANTIWAIATLKEEVPAMQNLLHDLLQQVPMVAKQMKPQEAANTLWAGATLRGEHVQLWAPLVPTLTQTLLGKLSIAQEQEVANSLWAVALLGDDSVETLGTMQQLAQAATLFVGFMPPQGLSNTCYGLALRGVLCEDFFKAVSTTVVDTAQHWTRLMKAKNLPVLAWSFAKLGVADRPLLRAVAQHLRGLLPSFLSEWNLCALAFTVKKHGTEFDDRFVKEVVKELSRQELGDEAVAKSNLGIDEFYLWLRSK